MKFSKDIFKSVSFWAAAAGCVILLLQSLGLKLPTEEATAVVNSVCGILVLLGILNNPSSSKSASSQANLEDVTDTQESGKSSYDTDGEEEYCESDGEDDEASDV